MSQNTRIISHLKTGASLTPMEALDRFGCLRLSARILELREAGNDIAMTMIDVGPRKRVARYKLIKAAE